MQRSTSQKVLRVFSVLEILAGILAIILAAVTIGAGSLVSGEANTGIVAEGTTLTGSEVSQITTIVGVALIIIGILDIIIGILGLRAAKNNQKIMPVWVLALISVIAAIIVLVLAVMNGGATSGLMSDVITLVLSFVVFIVANNIKKERNTQPQGGQAV